MDLRAKAALHRREQCFKQRFSSSKYKLKVLKELRGQLYMRRVELMEAFVEADKASHDYDTWSGKLSVERLAEVLTKTLQTPMHWSDVWIKLGDYLYAVQQDKTVVYEQFLFRHGNAFVDWLARRWTTTALEEIAARLPGNPEDEFDRLDPAKSGKMCFVTMRRIFAEFLPEKLPSTAAEQRLQDKHHLALWRAVTSEGVGVATRDEFTAAFVGGRPTGARCTQGHRLQGPRKLQFCEGRFHVYVCERCHRAINRDSRRWSCEDCGYDLCMECRRNLKTESSDLGVKTGSEQRMMDDAWAAVEKAIFIMSSASTDLKGIMSMSLESAEDQVATKERFRELMTDILDKEMSNRVYDAVVDYLESIEVENDDWEGIPRAKREHVTWRDLIKCLSISDLAESSRGSQHSPVPFRRQSSPKPVM